MDETSPWKAANTQRLWSFRKQKITKNTSKSEQTRSAFISSTIEVWLISLIRKKK
ncbi:MAG: hypothetical protein QXQ46_11500 [Thermoplasmatales archaeon]